MTKSKRNLLIINIILTILLCILITVISFAPFIDYGRSRQELSKAGIYAHSSLLTDYNRFCDELDKNGGKYHRLTYNEVKHFKYLPSEWISSFVEDSRARYLNDLNKTVDLYGNKYRFDIDYNEGKIRIYEDNDCKWVLHNDILSSTWLPYKLVFSFNLFYVNNEYVFDRLYIDYYGSKYLTRYGFCSVEYMDRDEILYFSTYYTMNDSKRNKLNDYLSEFGIKLVNW